MKEERIGGPPIHFHLDMEDKSCSDSDINTLPLPMNSAATVLEHKRRWTREMQNLRTLTRIDLFGEAIFCNLLNDDLSLFRKAKILVCLPDEPFDEENLGDTDAGVLFLSKEDLQMTSFRWPLRQVRLEGGRLLSEIVT